MKPDGLYVLLSSLQIWDATTGFLLGSYDDKNVGATELCMIGMRVVIARLDGTIDFLDLVSNYSTHMTHVGSFGNFMGDHRGKHMLLKTVG